MAVSCGSWERCTTLVFSCDRSVSFTHTSGNLGEGTCGETTGGQPGLRPRSGGREVDVAGYRDGKRAPFSVPRVNDFLGILSAFP